MDEIKATLKILMANNFVMYFKSHSYHWNVEGMFFSQFHEFFGDLYADLWAVADTYAEQMRALDEYAPISVDAMFKASTIDEDNSKPADITAMLQKLQSANNEIIVNLNKLFTVATKGGEQGLANLAADRLDKHKKHGWMLRSFLKGK
jgi:starvation-inducible DNA-binding protein